MRRVVKETGTIILTTPAAVSLSNISMSLVRIFNKQIESEKPIHFDKKAYLAMKRSESKRLPEFSKTPGVLKDGVLNDETFIRIHERFRYRDLITMFHNTGLAVEQAAGAIGVRAAGLKDHPVILRSGGWQSPVQLTGTKPELGEYATEFGGLAQGEYIVELVDLAKLKVALGPDQFLLVEFRYDFVNLGQNSR